MCLLIAINGGADVTDRRLEAAAVNNPDGFGFAIHTGNHLLRFRSMDIDETITEWRFARKFFPDTPAVWHLRYATHGTVDVSNCHPFEVGHDPRIMLAHNGVLPIEESQGRSDTRILAESRLAQEEANWMDDPTKVEVMEKWLGSSKLAILSSHPDLKRNLYILNEGHGHWEDGVWYSNYSYEYRPLVLTGKKFSFDDVEEDELGLNECLVSCDVCSTEYVVDLEDPTAQTCPECDACYWCGASWCLCWEPEQAPDAESNDEFIDAP